MKALGSWSGGLGYNSEQSPFVWIEHIVAGSIFQKYLEVPKNMSCKFSKKHQGKIYGTS